jgi:hypothetical protein
MPAPAADWAGDHEERRGGAIHAEPKNAEWPNDTMPV